MRVRALAPVRGLGRVQAMALGRAQDLALVPGPEQALAWALAQASARAPGLALALGVLPKAYCRRHRRTH